METFYLILLLFLLLNMGAAMVRVWRGPTTADRLMTAQLFGSTGVALLLVMGEWMQVPVLWDVALVFALLAIIIIIGFVRTGEVAKGEEKGRGA